MKGFLDTSVLVAVFYTRHVHHEPSFRLFTQFDKASGYCGAHSLAEVYSTLTRMPGGQRVDGDQAMLFIGDICERLSLVTLSGEEYLETLKESPAMGITGGAIYDALLARCAMKAGAEILYTWNVRHFVRCGDEVGRRVRTPEG